MLLMCIQGLCTSGIEINIGNKTIQCKCVKMVADNILMIIVLSVKMETILIITELRFK